MNSLKQAVLIGVGIGAAFVFMHLAPIILAVVVLYFIHSVRKDKKNTQETKNTNAK